MKAKTKFRLRLWEKIQLGVAGILFIILVFFCSVTAAGKIGYAQNFEIARTFEPVSYERQLEPEIDEDGYYTFVTDEDFKILQLTDVHIGGGWVSIGKDKKALNAIAAMVTAEKPDLVVFTGDMGFPVGFLSGSTDNEREARLLAETMESLGVYWTVVFGNHDTENYTAKTRDTLADVYMEYEHCLLQKGPADIHGCGNYVIKIKNTSGIVTQALFLMDSNDYPPENSWGLEWNYDNIHQEQIDWYEQEVVRLQAANGDTPLKSLLFIHIPLREYDVANRLYREHGETDEVRYFYGELGEPDQLVSCGSKEDTMFETMLRLGSTQGVFCGHDHLNNQSLSYKGIRLTYSYSIDYLAYFGIQEQGSQRGCTVITARPDGTFACVAENYYQDKYVTRFPKESPKA